MSGYKKVRSGFYTVGAVNGAFDIVRKGDGWQVLRHGYPIGIETVKLAEAVAKCHEISGAEWRAHDAAQQAEIANGRA